MINCPKGCNHPTFTVVQSAKTLEHKAEVIDERGKPVGSQPQSPQRTLQCNECKTQFQERQTLLD